MSWHVELVNISITQETDFLDEEIIDRLGISGTETIATFGSEMKCGKQLSSAANIIDDVFNIA